MGTKKKRKAQFKGYEPWNDMSLILGFDPPGTEWRGETDEERAADRRQCWEERGPALVEQFKRDRAGQRPAAWWEFSSPEPRDAELFPVEAAQLFVLNELSEAEIEELQRQKDERILSPYHAETMSFLE